MRILHFILIAAFATGTFQAGAQNGCTDPTASNYDPTATVNDGSCVYPATHYNPILRAAFGAGIAESSGLVFSNGKLWTHNDSGNPGYVFSVDTNTGAVLQRVHVANYSNVDWESITADSAFIYLGDCGNNNGTRTDLRILKIAKADIGTGATPEVNAQAIAFSYTDQTSFVSSSTHNFDCEAMISIGDSLYLFTKDRGDSRSRVYKLPKTPGTYAVSPYTNFNAGGLITDASYNPDTKEIILVGYLSGHTNSFLWFLNDYKVDSFFSGNKRRVDITNGVEWQTEGVCWLPGNQFFFISCEATNSTPSSFYACNRNLQSNNVKVEPTKRSAQISAYPIPAKEVLQLKGLSEEVRYEIYDVSGRKMQAGSVFPGKRSLSISRLPAGNYSLHIYSTQVAGTDTILFTKE